MLLLRGDKGREAAKDSPGPEGVRDSPSSLEGTRLVCLLLAVVRISSLLSSFPDQVRIFPVISRFEGIVRLEVPGPFGLQHFGLRVLECKRQ